MASTATPLRTVPTPVPRTAPVAPAPGAGRRRGNHPAGRALVGATTAAPAQSVAGATSAAPGESLATVLPLRPVGAQVVPLRGAVPPASRPRAEVAGPVRLTRRGRLVLAGLGVVSALGVAVVALPALAAGGAPALELAGRSSVVVHSGDTLWSIAQSIAPEADPRAVVDALQEVNGLTDAGLVPGQVLVLP